MGHAPGEEQEEQEKEQQHTSGGGGCGGGSGGGGSDGSGGSNCRRGRPKKVRGRTQMCAASMVLLTDLTAWPAPDGPMCTILPITLSITCGPASVTGRSEPGLPPPR